MTSSTPLVDPVLPDSPVELITTTEAGRLISEQANICGYQFLADNRRRTPRHRSRIPFTRARGRVLYDRRVIEDAIQWLKALAGAPMGPLTSSISPSDTFWSAFVVGAGPDAGVRVVGLGDVLMTPDDAERFAAALTECVRAARVLH